MRAGRPTATTPKQQPGQCWHRLRTRPKSSNGDTESLRLLRVVRRGAIKARIQGDQAMCSIVVTAPAELREQLRDLSAIRLATLAERFRPGTVDSTVAAAKVALRSLARRRRDLMAEIEALDKEIARLVTRAAPQLLALPNVGPEVAATLLIAAGDNPERLRSESAFAHRRAAGRRNDTASTAAGTANRTTHCGPSPSGGCFATRPPRTTSPGGSPRDALSARSSAA